MIPVISSRTVPILIERSAQHVEKTSRTAGARQPERTTRGGLSRTTDGPMSSTAHYHIRVMTMTAIAAAQPAPSHS